jgi:hypothetical protein
VEFPAWRPSSWGDRTPAAHSTAHPNLYIDLSYREDNPFDIGDRLHSH